MKFALLTIQAGLNPKVWISCASDRAKGMHAITAINRSNHGEVVQHTNSVFADLSRNGTVDIATAPRGIILQNYRQC
jgi:hypothetical protein